jgi:TonB family protein
MLRLSALILLSVSLSAQQQVVISPQPTYPARILPQLTTMDDSEGPRLEALLTTNPEDLSARQQLLTFYSQTPERDSTWSNRVRLLQWLFENHPESSLAGHGYPGMPSPLFQELKRIWVSQVQRHADTPAILRNAANFMDATVPAVRVGANVQAANLIRQVNPPYPPLARQAGIQGTVHFAATIGEDGHVVNLQLASGHPLLVSAAQEAAAQWVYKPVLLNGQPVRVTTTIDINFTLSQ